MAKRPPSLEDTGIPRTRKREAAPAVLDDAPEKPIPTPMILRPGYKPQGKEGEPAGWSRCGSPARHQAE